MPPIRVLPAVRLAMLLAALSPILPLSAAPGRLLSEYAHTAWGGMQGAPNDVLKFAQTRDGWLWMTTPTGLYRFDGVAFERVDAVQGHRLESTSMMGLLATPDGALWVGYRYGGISVFRDGAVRTFKTAQGLPDGAVFSMTLGPDGTLWAATAGGLAHLAPGASQFQHDGAESGLPPVVARQVLFDRNGRQWVSVLDGIYSRAAGAARFQRAWPYLDLMAIAELPDGSMAATDGIRHVYRLHTEAQPGQALPLPDLNANGLHVDRDNVLWTLAGGAVERHWPDYRSNNPSQQLTRLNGMSGQLPQTFLQDREGNIWIGTASGVDRLRRNRITTLPVDNPFDHPSIVALGGDQVLIGDSANDIHSADRSGLLHKELAGALSTSYRTPDGTLWLGNGTALWRRSTDGKLERMPRPPELKGYDTQAMTIDRQGQLWISIARRGLFRISAGQWHKNGGLTGLPPDLALCLATDGQGRIWSGHLRNQLAMIDGTHVTVFGAAQGLQVGSVMALLVDGPRLWIGGEYGMAWFDGQRFAPLAGRDGQALRGVSGIVRTAAGELWLHGADGITRIGASDVAAALRAPGTAVPFERFNAHDGLQGSAEPLRPLPSLIQAGDGRLWFATASEVGTIDPTAIARNPLPPPVQVRGLRSGGMAYQPSAEVVLPRGSSEVQIGFTALSLTIPERVRFRYRLHGVDGDWQETVGRREAFYTNLLPGSYRFEVTAANEDGVWNAQGSSVLVTIPPRFVQTRWFTGMLVVLCLMALGGLYLLRMRQVAARMRDLMQERLAERARIARGLHDTLLQSVQGLIMFFDGQARRLPSTSEERRKIEQTLALADQLMVEGRDYIMELRSDQEPEELSQSLGQYGSVLLPGRFQVQLDGKPRTLQAAVRDEFHAIGREALLNAARHAQASQVTLSVRYGADTFQLQVRDDGCGIDPAVAEAGQRDGHWGLVGMRERAAALHIAYRQTSAPQQGTTVCLSLPAAQAYLERRHHHWLGRLRRLVARHA